MKNLMIAAAIVCAAAFTQAATCTWSATTLQYYDGSAAPAKAGTVNTLSAYLFTASTSDALGTLIDSVTAGLANGDLSGLDGKTEMVLNKTTSNQIVNGDTGNNSVSAGTLYGQIIFLNDTDASKATYFFVSNEKSTDVDAGLGGAFTFGSQKDAGMNVAGNWTAMAVPEPTSGLLLLLGVAGLALKRKRT